MRSFLGVFVGRKVFDARLAKKNFPAELAKIRARLPKGVEIELWWQDEARIGQTKTKSIVAIAAEVRGRGTGRIRMSRVEDVAARSLIPFVQTTVAPGATVRTDGWSAYSGLANQGYDHQPRSISASGDPAHIVMPRVHRVAALLDRWWLGIHHGAIDADHLDYYLDEFTFRFNRRRSQARGLLFFRLLQQAVQHEPVPYKGLVGGHRSLGNQM